MVLYSVLGRWEIDDEVEFVEEKACGCLPFVFFGFGAVLLQAGVAAAEASQ